MTVKELIDELKKCDQNSKVLYDTTNAHGNDDYVIDLKNYDQSYEIETVSQNGTTVFLGEEIRY